MNFFVKHLLALAFFIPAFGHSLIQRPEPLMLKTSVIIPCEARHAHYLPNLLNSLSNNQTTTPDEVVISISRVDSKIRSLVAKLRSQKWPYALKILTFSEMKNASQNRNLASINSQGDILIYQDADDLPHPRRIEVVKFFFQNYEIDHLTHRYTRVLSDFPEILSIDEVEWFCPDHYSMTYEVANGVPCISRNLFSTLKWPENLDWGEDVAFNQKVYNIYESKIVVLTPLYYYNCTH